MNLTLAILLGVVNILFGPMTVHYREVLLYDLGMESMDIYIG